MNTEPKIILNRIKTPDGTILTSYSVHDYVSHVDAVSKETYITDGGTCYLHRSANTVPYEDLTVYDTEPFEVLRGLIHWGTYGKNPVSLQMKWIPLSSMSNDHINAILGQKCYDSYDIRKYFVLEIEYRRVNDIVIED